MPQVNNLSWLNLILICFFLYTNLLFFLNFYNSFNFKKSIMFFQKKSKFFFLV